MGQFNKKLLESLALTVDPKNNDSMEVYGKLGKLGFNVDGLADIYQFRNALFKLLLLRAVDQYDLHNQSKKPEKDRSVTVRLEMTLTSPVVHSNEQMVEHGIVSSVEEAARLRGTTPLVTSETSDTPDVAHIINLINTGVFSLACN